MNSDYESSHPYNNGGNDRDPLFSRTIKAGKRVYYLDVKRDRRGEYYVALTESRRVQDGTETERPVFEKHKIFVYREDVLNFLSSFTEAAKFIGENRPLTAHERRAYNAEERPYGAERRTYVSAEGQPAYREEAATQEQYVEEPIREIHTYGRATFEVLGENDKNDFTSSFNIEF